MTQAQKELRYLRKDNCQNVDYRFGVGFGAFHLVERAARNLMASLPMA